MGADQAVDAYVAARPDGQREIAEAVGLNAEKGDPSRKRRPATPAVT